ncbi:unnamed protein product [Nippostrongylus brasiliensis]|uniref:EGF-like domain-containing protein n=1 Tax=Nippostrongylus brasiliensis TaxID=27835 RepID=A0A0N4YHJ7_NIPBR|nr:unnamed protein product [Nippostrongylus brasiliensis]
MCEQQQEGEMLLMTPVKGIATAIDDDECEFALENVGARVTDRAKRMCEQQQEEDMLLMTPVKGIAAAISDEECEFALENAGATSTAITARAESMENSGKVEETSVMTAMSTTTEPEDGKQNNEKMEAIFSTTLASSTPARIEDDHNLTSSTFSEDTTTKGFQQEKLTVAPPTGTTATLIPLETEHTVEQTTATSDMPSMENSAKVEETTVMPTISTSRTSEDKRQSNQNREPEVSTAFTSPAPEGGEHDRYDGFSTIPDADTTNTFQENKFTDTSPSMETSSNVDKTSVITTPTGREEDHSGFSTPLDETTDVSQRQNFTRITSTMTTMTPPSVETEHIEERTTTTAFTLPSMETSSNVDKTSVITTPTGREEDHSGSSTPTGVTTTNVLQKGNFTDAIPTSSPVTPTLLETEHIERRSTATAFASTAVETHADEKTPISTTMSTPSGLEKEKQRTDDREPTNGSTIASPIPAKKEESRSDDGSSTSLETGTTAGASTTPSMEASANAEKSSVMTTIPTIPAVEDESQTTESVAASSTGIMDVSQASTITSTKEKTTKNKTCETARIRCDLLNPYRYNVTDNETFIPRHPRLHNQQLQAGRPEGGEQGGRGGQQ